MTTETILRVAAKGDGMTGSGRHIPRAAPGDIVRDDRSVCACIDHETVRALSVDGGLQHEPISHVAKTVDQVRRRRYQLSVRRISPRE